MALLAHFWKDYIVALGNRQQIKRATAEQLRLDEAKEGKASWMSWGPYLSERQWGTVREDYSENGDAWDYFSHDQARSRAYHWGEDGLAGYSDDQQFLCFSVALWNGKDPILKERLFGLTNSEGNHGEDVKEYYFYLDSTPTHSYMKYLYKYPQNEYPYRDLIETNRQRNRNDMEYELLDTGAFNGDRYFDVFVEYAKAGPNDTLIQISIYNRGSEPAALHVLPTLLFRNTWTWWPDQQKPSLQALTGQSDVAAIAAAHPELGSFSLYCEGTPRLLFTENETNNERIFGTPNTSPYVKDGINDYVVSGRQEAVNPNQTGTKAAAHYRVEVGGGQTASIRLRLTNAVSDEPFGAEFEQCLDQRRREADEFYRAIAPAGISDDAANVMRQALAGMLWSKQHFFLDTDKWLEEHGADAMRPYTRQGVRNREWFHLIADHIISMPDKWEYPWFAAWDLAFHTIALSTVDIDFAKDQLDLLLQELYLHPTGQIPAYEWNFSDVNPPVQAWAAIFLYRIEQALRGAGDLDFLKRVFGRLSANFGWWVNRKDRFGRSLFEGGFLGLDNIGVFDRSAPLPTGGHLEQADGTAWVALFCQNMIEIAVELAAHDPTYEELASTYTMEFMLIAHAMNTVGPAGMWDEEDGFYYDVLRLPDGSAQRLKVRSMVGSVAAVRRDLRRQVAARARAQAGRDIPEPDAADAGTSRGNPRDRTRTFRRRGAGHHRSREREQAAPHPDPHARRERVPQPLRHSRVVALPRRSSLRLFGRRSGISSRLPAGRVRHRHVRRQLQLAGSDLDAGQRPDHPRAAPLLHLLWRQLQNRVPDRLGQFDEPVRGGARDHQPINVDLPARPRRTPAGFWRGREIPERSALARLPAVLRVLPW